MKYTLLFVLMIGVFGLSAQESGKHGTIKVRKDIPVKDYVDIDFIPEYDYGILNEVIQGSMKYPKEAIARGIEGRVDVLVIIDTDGSIVWHQADIKADSLLRKEAIRIINGLSTFVPVKKDSKKVNVRTTIPVLFEIED